jgi:hypothetical protein
MPLKATMRDLDALMVAFRDLADTIDTGGHTYEG